MFYNMLEIGEGGFGKVYKAHYHLDQQLYAIKMVKLYVVMNDDPMQQIYDSKAFKEQQVAKLFTSQYIVRYYNLWYEEFTQQELVEEKKYEQSYLRELRRRKKKHAKQSEALSTLQLSIQVFKESIRMHNFVSKSKAVDARSIYAANIPMPIKEEENDEDENADVGRTPAVN